MSLTPAQLHLTVKQSMQMHLMLNDNVQRPKDITSSARWLTSDVGVSVNSGMVTCQQVGTFSVHAILGAFDTGATVTCTPPRTLADIRLANIPAVIRSESPFQFSLLADYSDGTVEDITTAASWTTENSTAYVASPGNIFCNTAGSATITAQLGSRIAHATFDCILKRITPPAGFTESAQEFYGPFPSWIDVKAKFGAKGDGVTDDTQALQHALDSLVTRPAVLWIPQGKYVITQTLHLRSAGAFSIIGEDPGNTSVMWEGPVGGTMISIEGCNWFRVGHLSWDGMNIAAIAMSITSTLTNGEHYPTFDAIQDETISNVGIGLRMGFAGETSIQRVHFDRNTKAGISLEDWDALNFNVIDSLFTDCNLGVTNWYGAGTFNVSNSVFVRSQTADLAMGNTGPFSERQNISVGSKAFFISSPIGAGANIILQANTIINPKTNPIQIGSPGPVMLVDNEFLRMDPSFHIVVGVGYYPLGVFSLGNTFIAKQPFGGYLGHVTSIDEATSSSDSSEIPNIPSDVYAPPNGHRPVYDIASGSTAEVIQQVINTAASNGGGAVVHFPLGNFSIDQTLEIPNAAKLAIVGDGPVSALIGSNSLSGPIMQIDGTSVVLENIRITSFAPAPSYAGVEIAVDDVPSTVVECNLCKTSTAVGFESSGVDEASLQFRIATLNASILGASIQGGASRMAGDETAGRTDAFMTGSDAYQVTSGGHFLIEDGWHDTGQGPVQFDLNGAGLITHQGGTIYTSSTTGTTIRQFTGELSLLGVDTNSILTIDNGANARVLVADTSQIGGLNLVEAKDDLAIVGRVSNYTIINNGTPVLLPDVTSTPSWTEHMFAQTRTEYVIPNRLLLHPTTHITINRLEVDRVKTGIRVLPKQISHSAGTYNISAPLTSDQATAATSLTCPTAGVSMTGEWTMQSGVDGFYGLKGRGAFLSSMMTASTAPEAIGLADTMSDARQRWIIRPVGDGLFEIVNRASGNVLTRGSDGCTALYPGSGSMGQEWVVTAL